MPTTTLTCASPPRRCPTIAIASLTSRSADAAAGHDVAGEEEERQRQQREGVDAVEHLLDHHGRGRSAPQITSSDDSSSANEIGTPASSATVSDSEQQRERMHHRSRPLRRPATSRIASLQRSQHHQCTAERDDDGRDEQRDAQRRRHALNAELREAPALDEHHCRDGKHRQIADQPLQPLPRGRCSWPSNKSNAKCVRRHEQIAAPR